MKKEIRTIIYDDELRIEAYRFEGIVQPFPNHFHEHYVIGFIENGERCLSCKNQEYTILAHLFIQSEEKLRVNFLIGFVVAVVGIVLISFNGSALELNPMGDLLAVIAAFVWACYSILTRKISSFGYPVILTTRRTFLYGILFMIPTLFFFDFELEPARFKNMANLLGILYLGLGASALCFVTWNFAVKRLGAVKTSVYIYMVPVITVITSVFVLREQVTVISGIGTVLTLIGLFLSESILKAKGGK